MLGDPIDPQGFEVAMDIKLGQAKEFLEVTDDGKGKIISLRQDLTAQTTESSEQESSSSEGNNEDGKLLRRL